MNNSLIKILTLIIFFHTSFFNNLFSQDYLKKEVQVVRPYEPAISDAFKQNIPPKIIDTVKVNPIFEYSLKPFPVKIDYELEPIKAAKLIGEPLKKLYNSYLKIGFGNYLTPLVDVRYNSKYSKKHSYQAGFKHFSSSGKIKNEESRKIFSGFSENTINVNGSKFMKNKTLSGNFVYDNNTYYYYGYNTKKEYAVKPPSFKNYMNKQRINALQGTVNLKSNYLDSTNVNYDLALSYGYMNDIYKIAEQNIDLTVKLNYFFENEFTGINSRITNYNRSFSGTLLSDDSRIDNQVSQVNTLIEFDPWVGAFGPKWQIVAGLNTFYELENADYNIYPNVSLHYNVIGYFLIPYLEYQGKIDINSFEEMLFENPYYLFPVNVKSTDYKKIITAGFRGNISSDISFNLGLNYNDIQDMYFYINDIRFGRENRFTIVYDDLKLISLNGEISYKQSERINFLLKAKYNHYNLENIDKPWHKPNYELSLNTRYNLKNKILVDFNLFALGKRYAKEFNPAEPDNELNEIIDVNLSIEYRYSRILSGFISLNNIGAARYYKWNYYPTHRFNFMIGLTYSM